MFKFNKFCLSDLKLKLEQARSLVDNEAEHERDKLDNQFRLLRQLLLETDGVDEGTLRRVKILEDPVVSLPSSPSQGYPNIISPGLMSLREGLNKPSGKRRSVNMTEESVFDVDDLNLSFDETANLCESRARLEQSYLGQQARKTKTDRKRSRSVTRREEEPETEQEVQAKKRERRSRSVGINDRVEILEITPRMNQEEKQDDPPFFTSRRQEHSFEEKTNIKSDKCFVCNKRLKFGKKSLNCVGCKMVLHPECAESVQGNCRGQLVTSSPTTVNTNPSIFLSRTPSKKEKKIFASPMLQ